MAIWAAAAQPAAVVNEFIGACDGLQLTPDAEGTIMTPAVRNEFVGACDSDGLQRASDTT